MRAAVANGGRRHARGRVQEPKGVCWFNVISLSARGAHGHPLSILKQSTTADESSDFAMHREDVVDEIDDAAAKGGRSTADSREYEALQTLCRHVNEAFGVELEDGWVCKIEERRSGSTCPAAPSFRRTASPRSFERGCVLNENGSGSWKKKNPIHSHFR